MIIRINHTGISTGNFDRSLHFYRDLVGMEVLVDTEFSGELYDRITALEDACGRVALLALGDAQIELFEFSSPSAKKGDPDRPACDHGITHICFDVEGIEEEYARLKSAGVEFHCAPLDFGGRVKATYGRDPDGNIFELREQQLPGCASLPELILNKQQPE